MAIKDGCGTSFWLDRWVGDGEPLLDRALDSARNLDPGQPVAAFVNTRGEWNVELLAEFLPPDAISQVIGVQPPIAGSGEDVAIWFPEDDGRFRVRSAYDLAINEEELARDFDWRTIWRWEGPARIRHFLWLAARERLLTNEERGRRHLTEDTACPLCRTDSESVLHVLRDCSFSRLIWLQQIPSSECQPFFGANLHDWLLHNLRSQSNSLEFGITCWSLWRTRNDRVFAGKIITPETFLHRVRAWIPVVRNALDKDRLINKPSPPARTELRGLGAAGGLIRDHIGRCLSAFTLNLGACTITQAELRGAVEGLQVVWDRGYRKVRVQLDSQCPVHLIGRTDTEEHHCAAILARFRELMSRPWEVEVEHVYREGNRCADFLASRGHVVPFGFHEVVSSDPMLSYWIMYDCQGVSEPRLVLNER
ncbi:unnamed protein product [Linum tenue]|uniref:Uncharacterized protein n=1 Tax=Linum tenue TaxID=586396 RepID=A0AAV0HJD5_9ROSI|nr:unnamed protein product [Linum tenue]